jgi:hypothetical protein
VGVSASSRWRVVHVVVVVVLHVLLVATDLAHVNGQTCDESTFEANTVSVLPPLCHPLS